MLYYENVVDVLRGKAEPKTDGKEGLKTLEILIAAYLSARILKPFLCHWSTKWIGLYILALWLMKEWK